MQLTHPERRLLLEQSGDGQGAWDADRLAQVITNLVNNALHLQPGVARVRVRARGAAEAVVLAVHNMGEPIPAELLPALFQPHASAAEGKGPHQPSIHWAGALHREAHRRGARGQHLRGLHCGERHDIHGFPASECSSGSRACARLSAQNAPTALGP